MAQSQALTSTESSAVAPRLTLRTFGDFVLYGAGDGAVVGPGKPLALITYLHALPGRASSRDHLLHVLWGDAEESRARHALRQTIWQLRRLIGEDAFAVDVGAVTLRAAIHSDVEDFLRAVEDGRLADAVATYKGEFLASFFVPGALGFEQWADTERQRYRLLFQRSAESVTRALLGEGKLRSARDLAARMRDADPLDETGWRLLLQTILASGDRVSALTEAQRLEEALAVDNRKPEPATRALLAQVRTEPAHAVDGECADVVADLVGREAQFSALVAAFRRARRGGAQVLEVVAPAGFGKTRLLRDFARHIETRGHAAGYVRALPADRDLAWSYAAEVVRQIASLPGALGVPPAIAATLVGLDPSLSARWSNVKDDSPVGDEMLRRRVAAIEELVRAVCEEQPVALFLDDLHWADIVSRDAIERTLTRLHNASVLTVGAYRAGSGVTISAQQTIALDPLSDDDTDALIASLGELPCESWATDFAARLRETADGSPLLILETLKLALDAGCLTFDQGRWDCGDPVALQYLLEVGSALSRRIARLDESERCALLLLAVAGSSLSTALAATALGSHATEPSGVLARLERRGLALRSDAGWTVAHDEIADAATERAAAQQLSAAHELLGRALLDERAGAPDLRRVVRHFVAADSRVQLIAIAKRWVRAARSAGDSRHANSVVADLLAVRADDKRVQSLVTTLPWSLRFRRVRTAAIAGVAAIILATAALFATSPLGPDNPPVTIAMWKQEAGQWRLYSNQLTLDDLARGSLAIGSLRRTDIVAADRPRAALRPGTRDVIATTRAYSDSGGEDVLLMRTGTPSTSRVTMLKGDDVIGDWSPDGRYLVIQTDRWSASSMSDIAVIDPDNGGALVARLTREPMARDVWPLWSPDGSRIAFLRVAFDRPPNEGTTICLVSVDGAGEKCLRPAGHAAAHLFGWASPIEVAGLFNDSAGVARVLLVNTETGAYREIAEAGYTLHQSQVPGWIFCFCRRGRGEPFQSLVMSLGRPDQAVRLEPGDPPPNVALFPLRVSRAYLDRLSITGAGRPLPANGEYQTRLMAWDADGHPVAPLGVRWQSRDTTIAVVGPTGTVGPKRPGRTVIWVTAGGWRSDSAVITIAPADTVAVLYERWGQDFESRWAPFGEPRPFLVHYAGGTALAPNGDSSFTSGVYLTRALPTRDGLGVELEFSAPTTTRSWQVLNVRLVSSLVAQLSAWDHRTGQIPGADDIWRSCGFTYPSAGRRDQIDLAAGINRGLPVLASSADGVWLRVRLQVFEDGRCGIAVNDEPLSVTDRSIPLGDSAVLMVGAYSHRTQILVGPVAVWLGVRRDLNWPDATAERASR